jgi:threonine synthase
METAKAAKFGETVTEALGRAQPDPPEITKLLALPQHVDTIANDEAPLRALIKANALHA